MAVNEDAGTADEDCDEDYMPMHMKQDEDVADEGSSNDDDFSTEVEQQAMD